MGVFTPPRATYNLISPENLWWQPCLKQFQFEQVLQAIGHGLNSRLIHATGIARDFEKADDSDFLGRVLSTKKSKQSKIA